MPPRFPLTPGQRAVWVLQSVAPDAAFFNLSAAMHIRGPGLRKFVTSALSRIVRRHSLLRCRVEDDGKQLMFVSEAYPDLDLRHLDGKDWSDAELQREVAAIHAAPIDLSRSPPLRATLIDRGGSRSVVIVTLHHIVADEWSGQLVFREIEGLADDPLTLFSRVQQAPHFKDFVARQDAYLTSEEAAEARQYWLDTLSGADPALGIPGDGEDVSDFAGDSIEIEFSRDLSARVYATATRLGVSRFALLFTAWQLFLARIAQSDDVSVATPLLGRTDHDDRRTIGLFSNPAVVRARLTPQTTFADAVLATAAQVTEAKRRQRYPLERVLSDLGIRPDPTKLAFQQAGFHLRRGRPGAGLGAVIAPARDDPGFRFGPWQMSGMGIAVQAGHTWLALDLFDSGEELSGFLKFQTARYDPATVAAWGDAWRSFVESWVASPDEPWHVPDFSQPTSAALQGPPLPEGDWIDRFQSFADASPDLPAVVSAVDGATLTYAEVQRQAARFGRWVREQVDGELVAVALTRSPLLPARLLGLLWHGVGFVPIDPAWPERRVAAVLIDSGTQWLLSEGAAHHLPAEIEGVNHVRLDDPAVLDDIRRTPTDGSPVAPDRDVCAYVMYTSGSTGTPTGIRTTHRNFAAFLNAFPEAAELTDRRGFLARTSTAFDPTFVELILPLTLGARIVLMDDDQRNDPVAVVQAINRHDVDVIQCTPSFWPELLTEGLNGRDRRVRAVSGGETLRPSTATALAAAGLDVWNVYGPTETTIWVTAGPVMDPVHGVDLGRALPGVELTVRDPRGSPLPVGVPGELWVGGPFVSPGYLTDEQKTRERFTTDADGKRWYRTGDRVRIDATGRLRFHGRLDLQVKLRGYRLEPEEIENAAQKSVGVKRAAATIVEGESLVLLVEAEPSLDEAALRERLSRELPSYLRPNRVVVVETMPLSTAGKIDRPRVAALASRVGDAPHTTMAEDRTPDDLDHDVLDVWQELLSRPDLAMDDDLIELGANSLIVMRGLAQLRERFGLQLSMRDVYDEATVAQIAARLKSHAPAATSRLEAGATTVAAEADALPLASLTQERLWMITQLPGANVAYNIVGAVGGRADLQNEALDAAMRDVMSRHEMLRTGFALNDGALRQIVRPVEALATPLRFLTFRGEPEAARRAAVSHIRHEGARNLAPGDPPLFRLLACRLPGDEVLIAGIFHHLIFDGWSVRVISDDLLFAYEARAGGAEPDFSHRPRSYVDFAQWQRAWIEQGPDRERQLSYWKEQLGEPTPSIDLPLDRPRPSIPTYRGAFVSRKLSRSSLDRLRRTAARERATLFHVLLAALNVQLWRYSSQSVQTVGVPVAGRHFGGLDDVVGCFINTLALRLNVNDDEPFSKLVEKARTVALDALDHQDLPLTMLMEHVQRKGSNEPLFQVVLTLQNFEHSAFSLDQVRLQEVDVPNGGAQFDLTYYLRELDDGLHCFLEYNVDLFEFRTAQRLLKHFQRILECVGRQPDLTPAEIDLLGEKERGRTLLAYQGPSRDLSERGLTLQKLIAAHVNPDNAQPAITAGDSRLTYAELHARMIAASRHLRDQGVRRGDLVGLALRRDVDLLPWLLAVVDVGAAWLPLDPQFPPERTHFMLEDSEAGHLVINAEAPEPYTQFTGNLIDVTDFDWRAESGDGESGGPGEISPDDAAYLIYTSGSTGKPKGVKVSHHAICNFLMSMAEEPGLNDGDTMLALTTLSFDISNLELLGPLVTGGRVVIADEPSARNPRALGELIEREAVTVVQATPTSWRMLLDADWNGAPIVALCGGEPLTQDLAEALLERVGVLWNMYGPTEATVWCACACVERAGEPITLGRPVVNTALYVVDHNLDLVAPGVPGELIVAGANLASGYHNRPEVERKRFVDHPEYGRVYRTGDVVRTDHRGRLIFAGRLDDQIKVRGHRLEPAELESVLNDLDGVRASAVKLHALRGGDERLIAFVVPERSPMSVSTLRKALMTRVPGYMVPQHFVEQDALPLTPNGKVDRNALAVPDLAALYERATYRKPRTPMEQRLAKVWAEQLGIERIDRHDNFFELGGHSLAAVQVIARFHQETGQIISPQALAVDQLNVIANSLERRSEPDRSADTVS